MARKKSIPKDPVKLAAEWHKLSGVHFASFAAIRELCDRRISRMITAENRLPLNAQTYDVTEEGNVIQLLPSTNEYRAIAQTLQTAIAGERQALMMQYQDHHVAIAHVQQLGFLVQRPPEDGGAIEVSAEYVVGDE
ncbi:MAG: hypothetical protein ACRC62_15560 [Microcoleus sp.]